MFGGRLTALRWPERELVSVPAAHDLLRAGEAARGARSKSREGGELDLDDVIGKRIIETRLNGTVTIREENAAAALEVMSRFAVDPRWLVYLPPTMSPPATSTRPDVLEHPAEAFEAFRRDGVGSVVCEEKHMGSRAVVVVCRDAAVAARRFGVAEIETRGRDLHAHRPRVLHRRRVGGRAARSRAQRESTRGRAVGRARDRLAGARLRAPAVVGQGRGAAAHAVRVGRRGRDRDACAPSAPCSTLTAGRDSTTRRPSRRAAAERLTMAERFVDAYRRYCWPVDGLDGIALAPFQVLAGEGAVHALAPHPWHMEHAPSPRRCRSRHVPRHRERRGRPRRSGERGRGGRVVGGPHRRRRRRHGREAGRRRSHATAARVAQPGIKCRGREYLRIIYGAEYTSPDQLERLRERSLGHKRALAIREFGLGIEALERFVAAEPLYRVHECVFGVLALESEPVDPRL